MDELYDVDQIDRIKSRDFLKKLNENNKIPTIDFTMEVKVIKEGEERKLDFGFKEQEEDRKAEEKRKIEKKEYIQNSIEVKVTEVNNYTEEGFVNGIVKNKGDKTVSVSLNVYYLDKEGKPIFDDFEITGDIKPNYSDDFSSMIREEQKLDWGGEVKVEVENVYIKE